jgi:hypothetical protein
LELNEVTRACARSHAPLPQRHGCGGINLFLAGRPRQARNIELHLALETLRLVAGALVALAAGIVCYAKLEERRPSDRRRWNRRSAIAPRPRSRKLRQLYGVMQQARTTVGAVNSASVSAPGRPAAGGGYFEHPGVATRNLARWPRPICAF